MTKIHLDEMDNYVYLASNSNLPEVVVTGKAPNSFAKNFKSYLKNKTNSLIKNVNNIWNDIDFNTRTRLAYGLYGAHNASNHIDAIARFISTLNCTPKTEPGNAFLLNDEQQEKYMNSLGYFKTDDYDGIKKINKAVSALKKYRNESKYRSFN